MKLLDLKHALNKTGWYQLWILVALLPLLGCQELSQELRNDSKDNIGDHQDDLPSVLAEEFQTISISPSTSTQVTFETSELGSLSLDLGSGAFGDYSGDVQLRASLVRLGEALSLELAADQPLAAGQEFLVTFKEDLLGAFSAEMEIYLITESREFLIPASKVKRSNQTLSFYLSAFGSVVIRDRNNTFSISDNGRNFKVDTPTISWGAYKGDHLSHYLLVVGEDGFCTKVVIEHNQISGLSVVLEPLGADGLYYLCLFAVLEDRSTVAAKNNGFPIVIDSVAPLVDVGEDRFMSASITVEATVEDASPNLTYQWSKVSGPGNVSFGSEAARKTTIEISQDGTYVIKLVATDEAGNKGEDQLQIIKDSSGAPLNAAVSAAFTDIDLNGGLISGQLEIARASVEQDIVRYNVYWSNASMTKLSDTPVGSVLKSASPLVLEINGLSVLEDATHFLVLSANNRAEMSVGIVTAIGDKGVPTHAAVSGSFTDTDSVGGRIKGSLQITRATDESSLTHYHVYLGSNASTRYGSERLATLVKSTNPLSYTISESMILPVGVSHFLIYTANADGEMAQPVAVAIVDLGVPSSAPQAVSFTDTNPNGGQITGDIQITKASDESDITHYDIYFGSSSTTKLGGVAVLASLAANGQNHSYSISVSLAQGASHILVYSKNDDGQNPNPAAVAIADLGVPDLPC